MFISIPFVLFASILFYNVVSEQSDVVYYQPEQIHISYGENVSEIVVTWSTFNNTDKSIVEYGIGGLINVKTGSSQLFVDGGNLKRFQYIHKVRLIDLLPQQMYEYHCGSDYGWSDLLFFKTPPKGANWSPHVAIFGDLGNDNAQSLPRLQKETQHGLYDAIFHVGDFAYDFDSDNSLVGDSFMRQLEPIAAYVPYMTAPGNHEERYNFSNYRARFSMPGLPDRMFYSFNFGPAHIISFNTEYYYFLNYGLKSVVLQYEWLESDLQEATKVENRKKHPWIITMAHRPMYCSDNDGGDCTEDTDILRKGLPMIKMFGLEKLFYDYGVDLEIWAHEHSYERLWPVYNGSVFNGSYDNPYENAHAPIHIVTGSAGCKEYVDTFIPNPPDWSAFRSSDYGYTRMKIQNHTHLYMEQISDDKNGEVIDGFWIIKQQPYLPHGIWNANISNNAQNEMESSVLIKR